MESGAPSLQRVPAPLWAVMKPRLAASVASMERESPLQARRLQQNGVRISLRLKDGTVKEQVTVDWDGHIVDEWYEEHGIRGEVYRASRFAPEEIESWGTYEGFAAPKWNDWFRRARRWKVFAYADGGAPDV